MMQSVAEGYQYCINKYWYHIIGVAATEPENCTHESLFTLNISRYDVGQLPRPINFCLSVGACNLVGPLAIALQSLH